MSPLVLKNIINRLNDYHQGVGYVARALHSVDENKYKEIVSRLSKVEEQLSEILDGVKAL